MPEMSVQVKDEEIKRLRAKQESDIKKQETEMESLRQESERKLREQRNAFDAELKKNDESHALAVSETNRRLDEVECLHSEGTAHSEMLEMCLQLKGIFQSTNTRMQTAFETQLIQVKCICAVLMPMITCTRFNRQSKS